MRRARFIALAAVAAAAAVASWPTDPMPTLDRLGPPPSLHVLAAVPPPRFDGLSLDLGNTTAVDEQTSPSPRRGEGWGGGLQLEPPTAARTEDPVLPTEPEIPSPDGEPGPPTLAWLPDAPIPMSEPEPAPTEAPRRRYDRHAAQEALRAPLRDRQNAIGVALPAAGIIASTLLESARIHAPPHTGAVFVATIDEGGRLGGIQLREVRVGGDDGWRLAGSAAAAALKARTFVLFGEYARGATVTLHLSHGEIPPAAPPPQKWRWPFLPRAAPRLSVREEGADEAVPLDADHRAFGRLLPAGARGTAGMSLTGLLGQVIGANLEEFDIAGGAPESVHVAYHVAPLRTDEDLAADQY
jgi:hypothetical protein